LEIRDCGFVSYLLDLFCFSVGAMFLGDIWFYFRLKQVYVVQNHKPWSLGWENAQF
jgi:hypothetical protein